MATRNWNIYPRTRSNMRVLRNIVGGPGIPDRVFLARYNNRNVIGGIGLFAVGCIVGATVGLLFAPRSGQDLRNQLQNRVSSMTPRLTSRRRDREHVMGSDYGTQTSPSNLR